MLLRNDTDVEQVFPTENVGAGPGEIADLHWVAEGDPIPEGWSPAETPPHPFAPPVAPITEIDPVAPSVPLADVTPHPFAPPPADVVFPTPDSAAPVTTEDATNTTTTLDPPQEG